MIYEARAGDSTWESARRAIAKSCDKFLHNGKLYTATLAYEETGEWVARTGDTPYHQPHNFPKPLLEEEQ